MLTRSGVINDHAWLNNTWLEPYKGYPVVLKTYQDGRQTLLLDGFTYDNVEGEYISRYNGWEYTTEKLIDFN